VAAALQKTLRLAALEGTEHLDVIRVYTSFDAARAKREKAQPHEPAARTLEQEEAALDQFIAAAGVAEVATDSLLVPAAQPVSSRSTVTPAPTDVTSEPRGSD